MTTETNTKIKLREVAAMVEMAASVPEMPTKLAAEAAARAEATATRVVGGFKFHDPDWIKDRVKEASLERLCAVERFKRARDGLVSELANIDVEPLAVVPDKYWDEITERHDLVTLRPSLDGNVGVNGTVAHQVGSRVGDRIEMASGFLSAAGFAVAAFRGFYLGTESATLGAFLGLVVSDYWMHLSGLLLVSSILVSTAVKGYFVSRVLDRWIESHSHSDLVRAVVTGHPSSGHRAELRLPDPPADVISLLRKMTAARWEFEVTAEAAAIALNPPARDLFHSSYAAREEELEAIRRDPIIAVRDDGVVAILAQFGDFEWERAVVEDVVWSKPLPSNYAF